MKLIRTRLLLPLLAALFLTVGLSACGGSPQSTPTDAADNVVGIYRLRQISAAGLDLDADALSQTMGTQISIQLEVKDGKVADAAAYSDALQPDIILELPDGLRQARCSKKELCAKLETLHPDTTDEQKMLQEIREWLWSVEL